MSHARNEYTDFQTLAPDAFSAVRALSPIAAKAGLDKQLLELIKIRASQINGCAFCLAMHLADARKMGESEARLDLVAAWHDAPLYAARERAALAWTEALTLVTHGHVPDAVYEEVRGCFTDEELVNLSLAIVTINGWNRLSVAFRTPPAVSAKARAA